MIDKTSFNYEIFPEQKLQDKVDLYITPYNTQLNLNKFMDFKEELNLNMVKTPTNIEAQGGNKK